MVRRSIWNNRNTALPLIGRAALSLRELTTPATQHLPKLALFSPTGLAVVPGRGSLERQQSILAACYRPNIAAVGERQKPARSGRSVL